MYQKVDLIQTSGLSYDGSTIIKFAENLEFTVINKGLHSKYDIYQIENVKGDLEITMIYASSALFYEYNDFLVFLDFDPINKTFPDYGSDAEYTFHITAMVEMKEICAITNSIDISVDRLNLLKPFEFFKEMLFLPDFFIPLNYYIKKIGIHSFAGNDIEIHIENPYNVEINGKKGDYKIQKSSTADINLFLTFRYDPSKPLFRFLGSRPSITATSAKNAIDATHISVPDKSRPSSSQSNDSKLFEMLSNECYADAFLISSDQLKFPTHRYILAEFSTVFAEIIHQSKELPITINVEDFNAEIIQSALDFLHGKHDSINGKEMDVFNFAVKFNIKEIMDACCSFFEESVAPSNVCEYIQIAYSNNFEELKQKCLKILVEKKKEIDPSKFAKLPKIILVNFFSAL